MRITKAALQHVIDENPLHSLGHLAQRLESSHSEIEKLLKTYHLEDYRLDKIKKLRRKEERKRRDSVER